MCNAMQSYMHNSVIILRTRKEHVWLAFPMFVCVGVVGEIDGDSEAQAADVGERSRKGTFAWEL